METDQSIKIELTPEEKADKVLHYCAVKHEVSPYEMKGRLLTFTNDTKGHGKNIALTLLWEYYKGIFTEYPDQTPEQVIKDAMPVMKESDIFYQITVTNDPWNYIVQPLMKKPYLVILNYGIMKGWDYPRSVMDDIVMRRAEADNRTTIITTQGNIPDHIMNLLKQGEVRRV